VGIEFADNQQLVPLPCTTIVTVAPWVRVGDAADPDSLDREKNTFKICARQWTRELKENGALRLEGAFTADGRYATASRKPWPSTKSASVVEGQVTGATRRSDDSLDHLQISVSAVHYISSNPAAKSGGPGERHQFYHAICEPDVMQSAEPSPVRKRKSFNYDTSSIVESPTKRAKATEDDVAGPSSLRQQGRGAEQELLKGATRPPRTTQ
jgi:hypothetical protein